MKKLIATITLALSSVAFAQTKPLSSTLDIYFVDVEGGQATLFVTPQHESLLIDTGWPGHEGRDAARILSVAKLAGLSKLDYVLITHYHDDHVGGVPQLAARIPIGTFVDHGPIYEKCDKCVVDFNAYIALLATHKSKRLTVKVGDTLPFHSMRATIVSSNGSVISKPLPGAGAANASCAASELRPEDTTENGHSVGTVIEFGKFRTADLGDLTWDRERTLMCPNNRLGKLDLLVDSHHGWDHSSSPAFIGGVDARAAIMGNGAKKGGSLSVLQTFAKFPHTDLWQLHTSEEGGTANTAPERIANVSANDDKGFYFKVSAHRDGSFSVFNARTGQIKNYPR